MRREKNNNLRPVYLHLDMLSIWMELIEKHISIDPMMKNK